MLPAAAQASKKARQGVRYGALEALDVLDPETMQPIPHDGETLRRRPFGARLFPGVLVCFVHRCAAPTSAFWTAHGGPTIASLLTYAQFAAQEKNWV
jgi:fatty-acyl-CoA synthase